MFNIEILKKGSTMKKLFVSLLTSFVLLSFSTFGQDHSGHDHGIKWHTNLEKAMEVAKKESKPILVDFTGSDWCGWCIKLTKEVFSKKAFQEYAAHNLVMVELDFPRNKMQSAETKTYNEALLKKYGVRGFPTILLLDAKGNVVGQTGYQEGGPDSYVKHLKELLAKK